MPNQETEFADARWVGDVYLIHRISLCFYGSIIVYTIYTYICISHMHTYNAHVLAKMRTHIYIHIYMYNEIARIILYIYAYAQSVCMRVRVYVYVRVCAYVCTSNIRKLRVAKESLRLA